MQIGKLQDSDNKRSISLCMTNYLISRLQTNTSASRPEMMYVALTYVTKIMLFMMDETWRTLK